MGEMIASIAHQWRQPLTHLSYLFMNIKKNSQDHNVVEKKLKEANEQLTYMSKTIDDFRNFYKPTKEKEKFDIKTSIENTLNIANIKAEIKVIKNFQHNSNKNEFEQAILNILKNSIDAKADATIHITIDDPKITIKDNSGGIDKKDLDKIFIPYFTTKEDSDGIGLYISKMIVEGKMGGKLEVKTVKDETIFTIYLR
jgi:signal transduction histidine kinase